MIGADLHGRTALITGAASGIGLAAAHAFGRAGARVAVNYLPDDPRGRDALDILANEGIEALAAPGDVADSEGARAMVRRAAETMGRLDYLLNNAGTAGTSAPIPFADLEALSDAFWQRLVDVNLIGPFRCAQAAAPYLRKVNGAIVNTASIAGLGVPGSSIPYGATKAGLINLTVALARALGPEVRVNAVAPGFVETAWTAGWPPERRDAAIQASILKRTVQPEEVAEAMLFLCATRAPITAHTLVVDAGYSA